MLTQSCHVDTVILHHALCPQDPFPSVPVSLLTFLEFVQICTVSYQMVIFTTSPKHELQYLNLKFRLVKGNYS